MFFNITIKSTAIIFRIPSKFIFELRKKINFYKKSSNAKNKTINDYIDEKLEKH
jgi:transcription-repair coupling factor (superfamily II helicase)